MKQLKAKLCHITPRLDRDYLEKDISFNPEQKQTIDNALVSGIAQVRRPGGRPPYGTARLVRGDRCAS